MPDEHGLSVQNAMPQPRRALEIFLSVGAAAGILTTGIASPQAIAQGHHHATTLHAQGGEGGEGGETGHAAAAQSDLEVLVVLAQMQGHLLVAQELLNQQQFAAAEPHVGHPVDELYGALVPALQSRRIPPFLPSLEDLRQQVRLNPKAPSTAAKLAKAQQAIAAVAQGLAGSASADSQTVMAVVRQLSQTAVEEYAAAIAGDQVVEVIEYQDALGFLQEAQRLVSKAMASQPTAASQLSAQKQKITAMLQAFPTVVPPKKSVMSAARLQQLQKQL